MDQELAGPNAEAIEVWNDIVGPKWLRHAAVLTRSLGRHSDVALERHPIAPGERILEVGCGLGELAVELARRVGPRGQVVSCDVAERFLAVARAEPTAASLPQLSYQLLDAQTHPFEPAFDRVWSRFGTMFFQSAVAALRNLRGALRPGGELVMLTWRRIEVNDWLRLAKEAALRHLPPPEEGPTCGPGPFSMADPETVLQQLGAAGFERIAFEPIDTAMDFDDIDQAIAVALDLGPAGELVRLDGAAGQDRVPALIADLGRELAAYRSERGISLATASWCVTARRPAAG
jgi:SAM-dependent methyltransferase